MSILAECPKCRKKQKIANKKCKCGQNMDAAKKQKKVRYHVSYRLPGGKQKRDAVGYSISDAKALDGKIKGQKREGKLFNIKRDLTFTELTKWYCDLEKVKSKKYFPTIQYNLNSFNSVYGQLLVNRIKPVDLENYQEMRKKENFSYSYIDQHIGAAKAMINKAVDNDLISGDAIKPFRKVKKLLKKNSNARDRIITQDEYERILEHLPKHGRDILKTAYFTGMRKGEILKLTWSHVDMKNRVITLRALDTKTNEPRSIPICDELYIVLNNITRYLHNNHVFIFRRKPVNDIRTALKNACEKSGIPYGRNVKNGFTFHDLRHTFTTNMRKAGVQESVIMEITGHASREMFDRYNSIDASDTHEAVDRLGVFLQNVDRSVDLNKKGTQAI